MGRLATSFDVFAAACPFSHYFGDGEINNGYNCCHPKQECSEEFETKNGKMVTVGSCYCFSCPLGTEASDDDFLNEDGTLCESDIDWDGAEQGWNGEKEWIGEGEFMLVSTDKDEDEDVKQALFSYHLRLNQWNDDWEAQHRDEINRLTEYTDKVTADLPK